MATAERRDRLHGRRDVDVCSTTGWWCKIRIVLVRNVHFAFMFSVANKRAGHVAAAEFGQRQLWPR